MAEKQEEAQEEEEDKEEEEGCRARLRSQLVFQRNMTMTNMTKLAFPKL